MTHDAPSPDGEPAVGTFFMTALDSISHLGWNVGTIGRLRSPLLLW
jgi:hypothetical protein